MLGAYILNREMEVIEYCDYYTSFIWNARDIEISDFEMHIPYTTKYAKIFKTNYFVVVNDPRFKEVMVIDKITVRKESYGVFEIVICGQGLDSLLKRRVNTSTYDYTTSTENHRMDFLVGLWNTNFGKNASEVRKFPENIDFQPELNTDLVYVSDNGPIPGFSKEDYFYINCYDIFAYFLHTIKTYLRSFYRYDLKKSYISTKQSVDRSSEVFFSEEIGNLSSFVSEKNVQNVVTMFIFHENDPEAYYTYWGDKNDFSDVNDTLKMYPTITGLDRYEALTEAKDTRTATREESVKLYREYSPILKLESSGISAEHASLFSFGKAFDVGDIVTVVTELGAKKAYVSSYIISISEQGIEEYPSFVYF